MTLTPDLSNVGHRGTVNTDELLEELRRHLADAGFKSSIASVKHLSDLQYDLRQLVERGIADRDSYTELVSRYGLDYHFEAPPDFPTAQSIIITAVPQPKVRVRFQLRDTTYPAIIPPTYAHDTDETASAVISQHLGQKGYGTTDAILPSKPLAVHCGLAAYGRNNVTYIDGLGSFFRLRAFFSDAPCASDTWQELKMMDRCEECAACSEACPTCAITEDRFLIDATRCITYLNEGEGEFPEWIDSASHNCLVGCMICQDICPVNKDQRDWIVEGEEFSEEETSMILKGVSEPGFPPETAEKLRKIQMLGYESVLRRNLGVLIRDPAAGRCSAS